MSVDPQLTPVWQDLLLLTPAAVATAAAVLAPRRPTVGEAWRWARTATVGVLAAAGAVAVTRAFTDDRAGTLVRSDVVGATMLALVAVVGWVVVRYASHYLAGDGNERRAVTRFLATLAAVTVVTVANDLLLLGAAWAATSLSLHGLLTYFGDRPAAVSAAHKKFVLARCADAAMIGAVVAFALAFDTLRIDRIVAAAAAGPLPASAQVGVALVALAALLKCAVLPFHGWLIQVMEAPTPVSALLHAGVVNLGGFVLLRVGPAVDQVTAVRTVLVVMGATTAVLAALVMTTRISVKVGLAWSTCAQMGFMLLQCGLGMWSLALLHLVAHSLYKAHAFLGAGGIVRQTQRRQLAPAAAPRTWGGVAAGVALAAVGTLAAGWVSGLLPFAEPATASLWVLGGIVALAVAPLAARSTRPGWDGWRRQLAAAFGVPLAYFVLHAVAEHAVPHGASVPPVLLVVVAVAFAGLFAVQTLAAVQPGHALLRRLYPWVYGGFFLDDAFTRAVFSVWAPPAPQVRPAPMTSPSSVAVLLPADVAIGASTRATAPAVALDRTFA